MGFDNECILNIQSLAGEYFCPVCRLLVYPNEALQSQCTHLYCKPCLTYVVGTTRACPYDGYLVTEADSKPLIESNKALAETIGKIAVHCLYHRSGCQWQGPLSECTSHCSGCAFGNSPVVCNRCGTQIVHRQVQEHAQNCPGVQPQASQVEGVQDATATATATVSASSINAEQTQTANQSGLSTSQAKTSQTVAAPPTGQVSNQQANANSQAQAVAPAAVPTPEQWYQQQYQQYYHQFPGYDPYQQPYQNYYQQQAIQQYQQHPQHVQGQHQPQVYAQSQPHPQSQPPVQPQPQPQIQQPLIQPHVQPQPPQHVPVAVQGSVNPPHQLNPTVQPHAQMQSQAHPLMHGQPQPQSYSQGLPHAQPNPVQPYQQQHTQMPLYQQPQSQPQPQPQPQIQPQPHPPPPPQIQPQPQHPLPQLQPQPHLQSQPQAQFQPPPHPRPQLQPPPQTNQPQNLGAQSQAQHQPAHAVTGHQSYPQPQAHQQMQLGAQQPPHMHPQVGPLPHPPVQMHGQFPQQPPQMRPPQSHAPMPNQQQPVMLPSQGQVPSIPPAQQPVHLHSHQPGLSGPPRPVMQQPLQQPVPQQYLQHQQSFPVQTSGPVQNQLYPHGHYAQQQPMQSQVRPQAPLHSVQQNSQAYMSSQQNAALSHGLPPHQPQNYGARPMMPSHGAHPHSFPHSSAGFASASQVRPTMPGANQALTNQNYPQRTNNQLPLSSEQQTVQSGLTSKSMVHERQVDHIPEKSDDKKDGSPSQKAAQKESNDLVSISGIGADSVQGKNLNPDTDLNSIDAVEKAVGGEEDENSQVDVQGRDTDSELHAEGNTSADPAVKHMVKKEGHESRLESSPGGKSIENVAVEHKGASVVLQQGEHSIAGDTSLEQAEPLKEQGGKLPKDEIDGSQAIPLAAAHISDSTAQPQIPRTGRDGLQMGSQQRILSQSQPTTEGPGVDEFRSFSHGQALGKGFTHPAQPFQPTDQSRHQHIPMHYGPSAHQQFPSGAAVVQSALPPGPPYHAQVPGQPTNMLRPQGPGHLPLPGPPLNPPDHFQQPHGSFHPEIASGGIPGPSLASFGRGPSNFGPPERSFEPQSVTPRGHPMPPLQSGLPRTSQGEPLGSSNSFGGIMGRVPPHGPEGKIGQQNPINPMESEVFFDPRSRHLDGRRPDSYLLGSSERAPFGHTPSTESNVMRMNGPPVNESLTPGLRDERFKRLPEEGLNHFPMEPAQHINRVSRPLDKAPLGFNYDAGLKLEPGAGGAPGFLPPHHPGGYRDTGERARLAGPDGNFGRVDSAHMRPDFLGPGPGFGRHHMDRLTPRSPGREYQGFPTHDFGGLPRNQSGRDDIDGRESRPFGKGPRSFNFPPDPVGSSFHESRFPRLSGHLPRGELDGPGDLRGSDLIGQDIIPSHLRGEFLGPRNLPGHLLFGEPAGFGGFPGHGHMEERAGPGNFLHHLPLGEPFGGNKSVHPRLGEPGFRSSYSLTGGTDPFDNSRKRKPASMGMCRICKVDCESVEGLELHSQTREHQKMAMDMVISIKQQNAKKLNNHSTLEEPSKSRSTGYEVRANKP